jgi:hypothetical protein
MFMVTQSMFLNVGQFGFVINVMLMDMGGS